MKIFDAFNIDNYEKLFLFHGFVKLKEEHEYDCDYCNDYHYAEIFEKNGERFYFNYESNSVVKIGF